MDSIEVGYVPAAPTPEPIGRREADELRANKAAGASVSQMARRDELYIMEPEDIEIAWFLPVEVVEAEAKFHQFGG